jgi:hypothetical protein
VLDHHKVHSLKLADAAEARRFIPTDGGESLPKHLLCNTVIGTACRFPNALPIVGIVQDGKGRATRLLEDTAIPAFCYFVFPFRKSLTFLLIFFVAALTRATCTTLRLSPDVVPQGLPGFALHIGQTNVIGLVRSSDGSWDLGFAMRKVYHDCHACTTEKEGRYGVCCISLQCCAS